MIRHFLMSLLMYTSIILTALLILGIAKRFDDPQKTHQEGGRREMAACEAFKFDKCK